MSPTETGRRAEEVAAEYLEQLGFLIADRNWRTRWCEIDIVATNQMTAYLVEVKFRLSPQWGMGLEYITPRKLQQMQFAAEMWISNHHWHGDYMLSVIEVSGKDLAVTNWIDSV